MLEGDQGSETMAVTEQPRDRTAIITARGGMGRSGRLARRSCLSLRRRSVGPLTHGIRGYPNAIHTSRQYFEEVTWQDQTGSSISL